MRRTPYPIADLTKGMDVSVNALFLTDGASPNLDCVRFYRNTVRKDLGFRSFDDDSPERPMRLFSFQKASGSVYSLLVTVDDLYYLSAGSWTQVRPAPGSTPSFTGDEDDMMSYTVCQDNFIITNGVDSVYKFDGSTMDVVGGLTTILAKHVIVFYNCLILCNTIESSTAIPFRVRWSEIGDFETYTGGNTGYLDLLDTQDPIQRPILLGDRLFIFKKRSIWEIFWTGDEYAYIFDKKLVNDRIGTDAPQSCVSLGDRILFFGTDDWYTFDGLVVKPAAPQLRPMLYDTEDTVIGYSTLNRSPAIYQEETQEYIIALPTRTNDEPNLVLKYNSKTGAVTKRTKEVSALGTYAVSGIVSWTQAKALGTAWEHSSWAVPWKRYTLPEGASTILYGAPDGTIEEDDRATQSTDQMVWESKDFILAQAHRWLWFELWCRGEAFNFSYSTNQGDSWSSEAEYTPESETTYTRLLCRISKTTSNIIRMRVRTTGQLAFFIPTPWYVPRKRGSTV